MFPTLTFPTIENPIASDIGKAVQLVEDMADIIKMAGMSPMGYDKPGVVYSTVEQNLRFASDVLKKGLLDSDTGILALSPKKGT